MTTTRDYARLAQRVRAELIVAASNGRTLDYGQVSPHAHLAWFSAQVLQPIYEECQKRGEPDLTAILVRKGKGPSAEDAEEAARVLRYWQETRE